ncbi:MAG TPA: inorganic phosphate transporter [Candidatus Avibacteroides avistercoris]|uniref:Phosphate transporter n=1 Tax=Candidatus Avibacteroides avistercoris TaxID=2840690 RepID=A0A9D2UHU6_9BACT|nr:inorganic phosphate transporter [Candidatus Avibacteroides avistercoris]
METIYLGFVIFLFVLAIFDLMVGVSNDAVNFLNSAVGAKTASFKVIIIVAAIGVFLGATMSNGMMDIARHGIVLPEHYYMDEVMCIFLAVMITDVILLDIFNSLGLPTSTTVSMVFELLGAAFAMSMVKIANDVTGELSLLNLLNTEKALSVIIAIFVSVAIAFVFGTVIQFIARLFFSFNYKKGLGWKIGIFGGLAVTAIVYFLLINGVKGLTIMTAERKQWIDDNTLLIVGVCFVSFTVIMQVLHWLKVNVFKVIVLLGTFALAMAFAGNDLVNFIGVPLAGYDTFMHYTAAGGGDPSSFSVAFLNSSAKTPTLFLVIAGAIMVYALATSRKARNVIKTSVDLSKQESGDEMFGSSRVARSLVRNTVNVFNSVLKVIPAGVRQWVDKRMNSDDVILEKGAAFDMVRASVSLVLAGALIALGTSLTLPLSTTYVTFMVAMGTSLADRAWGRESAVYRITGVISVIGGWFITAGAAFIAAGVVVLALYYGGIVMAIVLMALVVFLLIKSGKMLKKKTQRSADDDLFDKMISAKTKEEVWPLLQQHVKMTEDTNLQFVADAYGKITNGFIKEDLRELRHASNAIKEAKKMLKKSRRKELICLRRAVDQTAIEKNTWLHLGINSCQQLNYCLRRLCEPCEEHVDNNFESLPQECVKEFVPLRDNVVYMIDRAKEIIDTADYASINEFRVEASKLKASFSELRNKQLDRLRIADTNIAVSYVYLNMIQESEEMISQLRHLLRAVDKFNAQD